MYNRNHLCLIKLLPIEKTIVVIVFLDASQQQSETMSDFGA